MPKPKPMRRRKTPTAKHGLKPSKLKVFDIPDNRLVDSPENPQEMDDATFDELVEGIRTEGFDEPIQVVNMYDDDGEPTGKYMITSGHHRRKAGRVTGMTEFPAIIKTDMDDAARKIALVRRNQLRGSMNSKKFTKLFLEVAPVLGQETAKRLMGFTKEAAFKKVFEDTAKAMPTKEMRKQLESAKETITSVDDLSSVVNNIFKREGSKAQKGYMVFSFAGKKHHYFQIGKGLSKMLEEIEDRISSTNSSADEVFTDLLGDKMTLSVAPKRKVTRAKTRKNKAA